MLTNSVNAIGIAPEEEGEAPETGRAMTAENAKCPPVTVNWKERRRIIKRVGVYWRKRDGGSPVHQQD